ncbi:glycosyltransferase family 2 protein [Leptospira sp. WS39.C2]
MNPKSPLVSIILPTHNRRYLLDRAIQSVLIQTYPHWELHIIDDGSTDETWPYLLSYLPSWNRKIQSFGMYEKSIQVHQTEHRGVSAARNFGIEKSKGDWICLIDSDDEWYRDKLSKQIQFHNEHPEFLFSQTNEIWNKKSNLQEPKGKYKKINGHFLEQSLEICMVTCSSFIAHKKTWESIGFFREEMKICEDYDLWNRILLNGHPIGLLEENLLIRYGGHEDQLSNKFNAIERFRLYSLFSITNELFWDSEKEETRRKSSPNRLPQNPRDLELLKKAIHDRLETVIQGRVKRGKDVTFLTQFQTQFLENQFIPKKDLLTLLDDSLF